MKKYSKVIGVLILFIIVGFGINCVFYEPTTFNAFIASRVYKTPANELFNDDNFYQCVVDTYNKTNNTSLGYTEKLSDDQLATITRLNCYGRDRTEDTKIVDTSGLEKMVNLEELILTDNLIESIDLSKNIKLEYLYLSGNKLTSLDVSNNTLLYTLDIGYCEYYSDTDVACGQHGNQITSLDVSKLKDVRILYLNNNKLTELDLSNNDALLTLSIQQNQITSLDVSDNLAVADLWLDNNSLTSLDVSNNLKLYSLSVNGNPITELDLNKNLGLAFLSVSNTELSEIDVTKNLALVRLYADGLGLGSIDISKNLELNYLRLSNNNLTSIDVSSYVNLSELRLNNNNLTTIDISKNPELRIFSISNNQLTTLDVNNNSKLVELYAYNNNLTSLDLSNNLSLGYINVTNNKLKSIDLSNHSSLKSVNIYNNLFYEDLYVYRNETAITGGNVKIPEYLNWGNPVWTVVDSSIADVDELGNVTSYELGSVETSGYLSSKYETTSMVNVVEISSDKYTINEEDDYIYVGIDNDIDTIKENINVSNENVSIDVDLNNHKLYVKHEDNILKEFDLAMITSSDYKLGNDYVYFVSDKINLEKITNINCDEEIKEDKLVIKYGNVILDEFVLVSISSEIYDLTKEYIYLGTKALDLGKIKNINCDEEVIDNKLFIKYNGIVLDEFNLASISSRGYDLTKEYIYLITDTSVNLELINTINCDKEVKDNKLLIKYGDDILQEYDLAYTLSEKYHLTFAHIYLGVEEIELDEIININCDKEVKDNKLLIKYGEDILREYILIRISSEKYDLSKDYIYLGLEELDVEKIAVNVVATKEIKDNKLIIKYNEFILDEFYLVSISSEEYDLTKDYIYTGVDVIHPQNIIIINGVVGLSNNKLTIKYKEFVLDEYDLVSIYSEKYNLTKDYIYLGTEKINLDVISNINCDKEVKDNRLIIKYSDIVLEEYDLVSISSDEYDLTKNYIYLGINEFNIEHIDNINCEKEVKNNKLLIRYGDIILYESDLISISSVQYDLSKEYICLGLDDFDISKISVINAELVVDNNILKVIYNMEILYEYDLVSISSEKYDLTKEYIYLGIEEIELEKIVNINCIKVREGDKLIIKYGDIVLEEYYLVSISSQHHDLSKDYIYIGVDAIGLDEIDNIYCEKEFKDDKLVIKYKNIILQEYDLVGMSSEEYDLTQEYIYLGLDEFDIEKISVTNCEKELKNNKLIIKRGKDILEEYDLVGISSDEYDLTKDYIYLGVEEIELEKIVNINCVKTIQDNKLIIRYGDIILYESDLVSISSDKYDLTNDYIYLGIASIDLNKVNNVNCVSEVNKNKLIIKYGDIILSEYDLVSISSGEYDLTNDYIYLGTEEFELDKIFLTNCTKEIKDNKLIIKYNGMIVEQFELFNVSFKKYKLVGNLIILSEESSYDEFMDTIIKNDKLVYKIYYYNTEVFDGNIDVGMMLKIYYNNHEIGSFEFIEGYIEFDDRLDIDYGNKFIDNVELNTKVSDILSKIATSGNVKIYNKDNEELDDNDKVGTGSMVIFDMGLRSYEYYIVINGDVDGDGDIKLPDIMKIANYIYNNRNSLNGPYLEAADFDNNGVFALPDIMGTAKKIYGNTKGDN